MKNLKKHLETITAQLTPDSTLEDIYEQLALLSDIEKSEQDVQQGNVYSTKEVKAKFNQWSK